MVAEELAEQTAIAVRGFVHREIERIEQKWSETFDRYRKEIADELVAHTPVDGKDALEITIQPEIDADKSYPRGTFAAHAGGLLRAVRKTSPLKETPALDRAGWSVVVKGIAEATVEYPTDRIIRAVFRYTDGSESVTEVRSPSVLDRGVFREGSAYERGDGVTFGGSFWIAQTDAPTGKPGTCADWRLAVKKGRDGADR